jgi:putative ABC transport system permease protein
MFRHYLVAAWRSASRDRLHSIINVTGLAVGLAAAILIALFIRHELSYEDFLEGKDRVYRVSSVFEAPDRAPDWMSDAPDHIRDAMALDFPEMAGLARVSGDTVVLRHGAVEAAERIFWADPGFLGVLGFKTIAGDAATALDAPDSVVLTRSMARKYFGTDTPLGATLLFSGKQPMRVTAVLEDLPPNTHLVTTIIASARAPQSSLAIIDAQQQKPGSNSFSGFLYVRLKPGVSADALASRLAGFMTRHFPPTDKGASGFLALQLDPIGRVHLMASPYDQTEAGSVPMLVASGVVGLLIIVVASINFINLMTARAARRALEVGLRKALGATRRQLIVQFMGEALGFAAVAAILALALVELALPGFDALLDRRIGFAYWRDPALLLGVAALVLLVGAGAGVYPALVLSRFGPASVLKSARAIASGGGRLRQALVIIQFAVSIGLAVATFVIVWQTEFATGQSLRLDKDQVALLRGTEACADNVRNPVAALPGVRGAVCSRSAPLDFSTSDGPTTLGDGRSLDVNQVSIDFGFFEFYGLHPLAGRFFDRRHGEDMVTADPAGTMNASLVINEAAVKAYGFGAPAAALGQEITVPNLRTGAAAPSHVIGVVPDFPIGSIRNAVQPSIFFVDPASWHLLSIRLDGQQMPATLAAIDRVWAQSVADVPLRRNFLDSEIERRYRDIKRQGRIFAGFAAVAILIGCLGLFGLSAFAAERRTKEIGIRKALGASTIDVTRLLIWQFVKPVLVANAIAWPVAWWFMRRWLDGFAYRIELDPTPFLIAGAGALVIAVGTTAFHAVQVARSRPVLALRYE